MPQQTRPARIAPRDDATRAGPGTVAGVSFASPLLFEGITHSYGATPTLRGVDLAVPAGAITCLLGPSGSGKTTLLRIAAGLEHDHGGTVRLGERVVGGTAHLPPERRGIAYMFQDYALFPHLSVLANVTFGLRSLSRGEARRAAGIALERVRLSAMADRYPHQLSGGQQQRVALARALAPRPGVILMDEPFSGLDARLADAVRSDTLAILRETGATALIVTHDAEEAMRLGDRIALMRDGRLVQEGTTRDLYRAPADLFAAGFFSDLNTVPAAVRGGWADTALGSFEAPELADGPATVALRQSAFDLAPPGARPDLRGRIVARRFLGDGELFVLRVDGVGPFRVRLRDGEVPGDATMLGLSIRRTDVLLFESGRDSA